MKCVCVLWCEGLSYLCVSVYNDYGVAHHRVTFSSTLSEQVCIFVVGFSWCFHVLGEMHDRLWQVNNAGIPCNIDRNMLMAPLLHPYNSFLTSSFILILCSNGKGYWIEEV